MEDFKKSTKPKKKSAVPIIAVLMVALIASVAVAQHRDPPPKVVETEPVTSAEETTAITIAPKDMYGRGKADIGRDEPNYVGISGYVSIWADEERTIKGSSDFVNTPWYVPVYEKNPNGYSEIGTVEHKTKVNVISQKLSHTGWGSFDGYLEVSDNDDNIFYINVHNFITYPYWSAYDLENAAIRGTYIAEYHNNSGNSPMSGSNAVEIADGEKVLVVGLTSASDKTNDIDAIVYGEWRNGYGAARISFDKNDLLIIY